MKIDRDTLLTIDMYASAILCTSFLIVAVPAGHGIALSLQIIFYPNPTHPLVLTSWLGLCASAASIIKPFKSLSIYTSTAGLILLFIAWLMFAARALLDELTIVTSIPFVVCFGVKCITTVFRLRYHSQPSSV